MNLNIGEKILTLRVNKNVTQELFAKFAGVDTETVQAWENGEVYPPLETVVMLAAYFGVSTDELLGVGQLRMEERQNEYTRRYDSAMSDGNLILAVDTMHEALVHFPDSFRFKCMLMYALFCGCDRKNAVRFSSGEIISLGSDILANCTDDAVRLEARRILCLHYFGDLGASDRARELAAELPDRASSRQELLPLITDGDDRLICLQANTAFYTASLIHSIREYADTAELSAAEKLSLYSTAISTAQLLCPDGDCGALAAELSDICKAEAALHMASGDRDKALDALESAANFAAEFDAMPDTLPHTSPMFTMITSEKTEARSSSFGTGKTLSETLLGELLELSCFEPLRYSEKLKTICEKLEKK